MVLSAGQRFNWRFGGCSTVKEEGGRLIINVNKINDFPRIYRKFCHHIATRFECTIYILMVFCVS